MQSSQLRGGLLTRGPQSVRPARPLAFKTQAGLVKKDLVAIVAEKSMLSKRESEAAVNAMFDTIVAAVSSGERVNITGFGAFEPRERNARKGRNPQTGEELLIPATRVPTFSAGKTFKAAVKESYNAANGANV